jgi:GPI ethanolamine phosphate transferase 1
MVAIGVVYLAFQKRILASSRSKIDSIAPTQNGLSRALIGAQVGKNFG